MRTVRIIGTGSALPDRKVTNDDLAQMVETSDEWIRERTGIGERRISEGDDVAQLASRACERALEMAGRKPQEVDLIIVATCSAEYLLPNCACQVQSELGASAAVAFDLNAACSGFLFALHTAYAYIHSGIYKNALIAGAEVLSKMVDWTDRSTCVLFGDGAGAAYVEACEEENKGLISFTQGADGTKGMVLSCHDRQVVNPYVTPDSPLDAYIRMDGQEVYRFATRQVPACIQTALNQIQWTADDIDMYILHQANIRIIEAVAKRLKVDIDKFAVNVDRVGNMSSATVPVLLDELNRSGRLTPGMRIAMSGFGAGLTYGACVLIWG